MAHNLDLDGNIASKNGAYLEKLRHQQARKVMPMIGPMLDEWELLPNDVKGDPQLKRLFKEIEKICRAMGG